MWQALHLALRVAAIRFWLVVSVVCVYMYMCIYVYVYNKEVEQVY